MRTGSLAALHRHLILLRSDWFTANLEFGHKEWHLIGCLDKKYKKSKILKDQKLLKDLRSKDKTQEKKQNKKQKNK